MKLTTEEKLLFILALKKSQIQRADRLAKIYAPRPCAHQWAVTSFEPYESACRVCGKKRDAR